MTRINRFLAAVLLAFAAVASARAETTAAGRPTAVKALLIALTDDRNIGPGVAADLDIVEGYLCGLPGFDPDRDLKKLTGPEVSAANIRRAVEGLDVSPTDVLFCYYAGHGAYDPKLADGDPSGGHFFQIPTGDLRRASLVDWLKDKGARLTVLITDTCNAAGDFNPPTEEAGDPDAAADITLAPAPESVVSRALAMLLFDYVGVVDVSGSSHDQYGLAGEHGSVSTRGLWQALEEKDESPRFWKNPFRPVGVPALSWEGFLADGSEHVHTLFQEVKEAALAEPEPDDDEAKEARELLQAQEDLRPQAFQLDVRPVSQPQGEEDHEWPSPFRPDGGFRWDAVSGPSR